MLIISNNIKMDNSNPDEIANVYANHLNLLRSIEKMPKDMEREKAERESKLLLTILSSMKMILVLFLMNRNIIHI